jgi:hypothetical protein
MFRNLYIFQRDGIAEEVARWPKEFEFEHLLGGTRGLRPRDVPDILGSGVFTFPLESFASRLARFPLH